VRVAVCGHSLAWRINTPYVSIPRSLFWGALHILLVLRSTLLALLWSLVALIPFNFERGTSLFMFSLKIQNEMRQQHWDRSYIEIFYEDGRRMEVVWDLCSLAIFYIRILLPESCLVIRLVSCDMSPMHTTRLLLSSFPLFHRPKILLKEYTSHSFWLSSLEPITGMRPSFLVSERNCNLLLSV
jgi:hypothetical protein